MTMTEKEQMAAALYESAKEGAIEILQSGVEPQAIALAFKENALEESEMYAIPVEGDRDQKRSILAAVAKAFPVFATVMSCWQASQDEVAIYGYPAKCPNRKSGVMVNVYQNGKAVCIGCLPFEAKPGGGFTWGDWKETGPTFDWVRGPEGETIFPG